MSKRLAETEDFGLLLKQKTKKAKEKKAKEEAEEKKKKRALEEAVVMGRIVSTDDIKAKCLVSFTGILKATAEKGLNCISIKVGEHQMIGNVSVRIFEWECRDIAGWLAEQFKTHEGLKVKMYADDNIFFKW